MLWVMFLMRGGLFDFWLIGLGWGGVGCILWEEGGEWEGERGMGLGFSILFSSFCSSTLVFLAAKIREKSECIMGCDGA